MRVPTEILRQTHRDAKGRLWQVALVPTERADEEDARFWYEELSPEERVVAVHACVKSALAAQGVEHVPRLRRVARFVPCDRPQDRADVEVLLRAAALERSPEK